MGFGDVVYNADIEVQGNVKLRDGLSINFKCWSNRKDAEVGFREKTGITKSLPTQGSQAQVYRLEKEVFSRSLWFPMRDIRDKSDRLLTEEQLQ